jgi:hypothetical protein
MVAILSPLSLHGGNQKTKPPLLHNTRIHTLKGTLAILLVAESLCGSTTMDAHFLVWEWLTTFYGPVWLVGWTDLTSVRRRLPETSGTHVGIARLVSRLSKVQSSGIRPMVLQEIFSKCHSRVCILVLCITGSFVFRLPPYKPRGERMTVISWNPNSFAFAIFPSYFA